jgi:hypothetical protein
VQGEWRTAAERRRDLERLVDAFELNVDQIRPGIDRLIAAILREHHPEVVAWLLEGGHPLTWEGVVAAAERLSRIEVERASVQTLDDALFAAVGGAVMLARTAAP